MAIRLLIVGVAFTSSTDSLATWSGFRSFWSDSMRAAMASLGFMDDERRFGVKAGWSVDGCGGVDQRRRRGGWGVSPASEKDGVVGFHRFWAHLRAPDGGGDVASSAGVSAVVGFHRRWAHCRAPDGGVAGAFCLEGDAGFQRFFAQSRRGDTDGAATMRAASRASGASASTSRAGESVTGVGGSSGAPTGSVGEAGALFCDASYFEIWARRKVFAAA